MERLTRSENTVPETIETPHEKELAALSYVWIFSLFILIAKRDSFFIQHHARRGLVLFVLSLLLWSVTWLRFGEFAVLILSIFGFIQAAMGNPNDLPILSAIADGAIPKKKLDVFWNNAKETAKETLKPADLSAHDVAEARNESASRMKESIVLNEEKMIGDREEKKLSALYNRVNEQEKKIRQLEDEIKGLLLQQPMNHHIENTDQKPCHEVGK